MDAIIGLVTFICISAVILILCTVTAISAMMMLAIIDKRFGFQNGVLSKIFHPFLVLMYAVTATYLLLDAYNSSGLETTVITFVIWANFMFLIPAVVRWLQLVMRQHDSGSLE